jgi:hypothetical protein
MEAGLRVGVLVIPVFLHVDLAHVSAHVALVVGVLGLALYYAAWTRYFVGGRAARLLFEDWRGIPLPLAVAPTVYLLAASVLTRSVLLALVAIAFGVVHIFLSAVQARSTIAVESAGRD